MLGLSLNQYISPSIDQINSMFALQFLLFLPSAVLSGGIPSSPPPGLNTLENLYSSNVPSRNMDVFQDDADLDHAFLDDPDLADGQNDSEVSPKIGTGPLLYAEDQNQGKFDFPQDIVSGNPGCDSAKPETSAKEITAGRNMCPPGGNKTPGKTKTPQPSQNPDSGTTEVESSVTTPPVDCSKMPGNPRMLFCCEKKSPTNGGRPSGYPKQDASAPTRRRECKLCKFDHSRVDSTNVPLHESNQSSQTHQICLRAKNG